ncbi:MAG: hypothetical protein QGF59_13080 [Pirellulaceae bacterium]|jgi:hypothetical protein|nr:hypothetical protein [Pirellulaceae bacterium]
MALSRDKILRNWNQVNEDRRIDVVYEGESATDGVCGNLDRTQNIAFAGILIDYKKSVWFDAEAFDAAVKPNRKITVDDVVYQILNTQADAFGALLRCDLGDVNA